MPDPAVYDLIFPDPDSQFKLLRCRICGGEAGYVGLSAAVSPAGGTEQVECSYCGRRTVAYGCRHDAQLSWNRYYGLGWKDFTGKKHI